MDSFLVFAYHHVVAGVEAQCGVETYVFDLLEQRGWTILGGARHGVDLDLDVQHDGTAGKILFRNSFEAPPGTVKPKPCFIRIDLGRPEGVPDRWALWDFYEFPSGSKHSNKPSYIANVFHEAIGASWVSVAGSAVGPKTSFGPSWIAEILLEHAEALNPSRDEYARHAYIDSLLRRNFSRQRKKMGFLLVMLLLQLGVVPFVFVWAKGGIWEALGVAPYLLGFLLVIFSIFGIVALVRRSRQPKKPVEGMEALAGKLRAAFQKVKVGRTLLRDGQAVVRRVAGALSIAHAPLLVSRLTAWSSSLSIKLEADLCQVDWPDGTKEECRFLPDRWLVIDLSGSDEALSKLPAGIRTVRSQGRVRWLLSGEDINAGRVEKLIRALGTAETDPSWPYR